MIRLVVIFKICLLWVLPEAIANYSESTLELVNILVRHGDRNPERKNLYPSNPYYDESNYSPYGYGQLTNEGMRRAYKAGTILRQQYDKLLGQTWNMSLLEMRTTDYNRTKMSAALIAAGLWPPTSHNIWNSQFNWQPIPYNYEKIENDKELSPFLFCPMFAPLMNEVLNATKVGEYMATRYREVIHILEERTNLSMNTYLQPFLRYFGFSMQEHLNFTLEDWVSTVYPEPLHSLVIDYYYLQTNTSKFKKLSTGYLLKKINIDITHKIKDLPHQKGKKMILYAGHETNLATFLLSVTTYKLRAVPPYGSYIALELHKFKDVYGIKILYYDYTKKDPELLQIPGCEEFCPFNKFVTLVKDILPDSDEECYGRKAKRKTD